MPNVNPKRKDMQNTNQKYRFLCFPFISSLLGINIFAKFNKSYNFEMKILQKVFLFKKPKRVTTLSIVKGSYANVLIISGLT